MRSFVFTCTPPFKMTKDLKIVSCHSFPPLFQLKYYFQMIPTAVVIRKGIYSSLDSYSAFADSSNLNETQLYKLLKKRCVTDVFVCGIATDVCVGE